MSPRKTGTDKTRFTLWLPDDAIEDLTKLQRDAGRESLADVIRDAIKVYINLLKSREEGVELYFRDATGETGRIWLLPGLPPGKRRKT